MAQERPTEKAAHDPLPHGALARFEPQGLRIAERATAIAISADCALAAAGGPDGSVHVYETQSGRRATRLTTGAAPIVGLAFADEGRELLATIAHPNVINSAVFRWKVSDWSRLDRPQIGGKNDTFPFHRALGNKRLAIIQANQVEVRDLDSTEHVLKTPAVARAWMPVVNRDGSLVAFGVGTVPNGPTQIEVWDVNNKKRLFQLEGPADSFAQFHFSADNKRLFAVRAGGSVLQWDLTNGKPLAAVEAVAGRFGTALPSPDSKHLLIGTTDGQLIQFELESGKPVKTIDLGHGAIQSIGVSADGRLAVCGGIRATIHIVNIESGTERFPTRGIAVAVQGLAAAPDSSQVAIFNSAANDSVVAVLDGKTGNVKDLIDRTGNFLVQQLAYSPDGRFVAAGTSQTGLMLWSAVNPRDRIVLGAFNPGRYVVAASSTAQLGAEGELTGEIIVSPLVGEREGVIPHLVRWQAHGAAVACMRFSADGKRLGSIGLDKKFAVWEPRSGKKLCEQSFARNPLKSLAMTPEGDKLALVVEGELQVWDVAGVRKLAAGKVAGDPVTALEFTADGTMIAVGDGAGVLRIYDAERIELMREQSTHQAAVTSLLAVPGDNNIVSGGDDGVVHVWNARTLERLRSFYPNRSPIVGLAFSAAGSRIGIATDRYGGWVWKFDDAGKPLHTGATSMRPLGVAFTADGNELVTIGDRRQLFRSAITARRPSAAANTTSQFVPPVYWPAGNHHGLAFSPDGQFVAAPVAEGIGHWHVATGVLRNVFPIDRTIAHAVAISPDGRWLAAGGLGIALWDLKQEKLVGKIAANESDEVYSLAFSPDSRLLAAGGNRESRVWDVESRRMTSIIETGMVQVGQLGFTADGYNLVALAAPPPVENVPPGSPRAATSRARTAQATRSAPAADKKGLGVWEIASGAMRYDLAHHPSGLASAFLSFDRAALYTGCQDGTVYRWDLKALLAEQERGGESLPLTQLWQELSSDNPAVGCRAIHALVQRRGEATLHIASAVEPAGAKQENVEQLIADLGSPLVSARREASQRLRRAGSTAWPKMQAALGANPAPAVRSRLEMLLAARIGELSGEQIRSVRAVQVLERIGDAQAREVLKRLASGLEGAPLTDAARAALAKLENGSQ